MTKIDRILIANRGEIACRVIRTCRKLGIETVAVFSEADRNALFVKQADMAVCIGNPNVQESYLNIDKLINAAKQTRANAIHPGYGFLSENAEFSARCEREGIVFIGPNAASIESMGSKSNAKKLLSQRAPDVPLIPGYTGNDQSHETLIKESLKIGFPVLLKASAGGGGKGMRVVRQESQLREAIDSAQREAKNAFGDSFLLIEKYFDTVRHVEFQIFGDTHNNVIHLNERECSIQRRHQKVIEETPSVVMTPELRERMGRAAIQIGKTINYVGAGTVEFIVDEKLNFYFLEVNTRLQVEHPITEMITGLDLVELQIQVARGFSLAELGVVAGKVPIKGHAIECRLYSENPANNFFPCTGTILLWKPAEIQGVRYDTGVETGSEISIYYDPLISKIIAHGDTREIAVQKLIRALRETVALGVVHNKTFLEQVLLNQHFRNGNFNTHFIDHHFSQDVIQKLQPITSEAVIAAMLWDWTLRFRSRPLLHHIPSGWRNNPYRWQRTVFTFEHDPTYEYIVEYNYVATRDKSVHKFQLRVTRAEPVTPTKDKKPKKGSNAATPAPSNAPSQEVIISGSTNDSLSVSLDGVRYTFHVVHHPDQQKFFVQSTTLGSFTLLKKPRLPEVVSDDAIDLGYTAPMPGKILKVLKPTGSAVKVGEVVLIMESMKMESKIVAQKDGIVKVFVSDGDLVDAGKVMLAVEEEKKE